MRTVGNFNFWPWIAFIGAASTTWAATSGSATLPHIVFSVMIGWIAYWIQSYIEEEKW